MFSGWKISIQLYQSKGSLHDPKGEKDRLYIRKMEVNFPGLDGAVSGPEISAVGT